MNLLEPDAPLVLRSKTHHEATFDITAMIDLVFMMNIFFLVTTVAAAQLEMDLPTMRHCVPTDPDDALVISVSETTPPALTIDLGRETVDAAITDPDRQKEVVQRAVRDARQAGKRIILVKAAQSVKLREIKRISAAAIEGTTDMELRFSVIETDEFR